ncbi:MAG: argininosuccinate lyase [Anaerolineae bacterium]|nr:argininosuccinate lyase [Anaerolineae bacterium]
MALWGGRFSEPTDADLKALNDSIGFDKRMYKQDIAGSMAYARAIAQVGVLTDAEAETIIGGLQQVLAEFEAGTFALKPEDEDIHTAVERRLTELVGAVGGKLHTGRSRNDQVATDFRLWVKDAMSQIDALAEALQFVLIEQAEQHLETVMPGYTHLQPGQPITAAHWLMSFFWMLARDRERLADAYKRTSVSPLGSGALAGTPLAIDRAALAQELGFRSYSQNSLDGVSDRDFAAETLFVLALLGTHLSRLGEDIVLYSNPQFGYITLNDRYSTGSSLMPQKRNADPMELARGKAGRLIGNLTGFLTTLKGLPSTYNKDLQEDKEAVFDSVDTLAIIMPVVIAIIKTLKLNPAKMRAALGDDLLATDLADYLVRKGLPFRQAHHIVGQAVQLAAGQGVGLSVLTPDMLAGLSDLFTEDVVSVFDFDASVARRAGDGGTAPEAVRRQIVAAREWMGVQVAQT